ncbi:hypothetical protein BU16DRAFT_459721 [Lophium mytilinum]|uniref:Uncharacterized protein n=1 Tax=Lophium mytilinum TaxID=390894 RepID=A0A6A6QZ74_9PEZI|nr:hypothetical protein BU16DRAFT_459721 [Lophium mytilinum]
MSRAPPTIDLLLTLVPDRPSSVLNSLYSYPNLASTADAHGYSLLHAAASYSHMELLKALIQRYNVSPNLLDEDGETALFVAETVEVAQTLVQLGTRPELRNSDGKTAQEKMVEEGEFAEVAVFLGGLGEGGAGEQAAAGVGEEEEEVRAPPPLPRGVQINLGTMPAGEEEEAPDPEFRRRIEELAASEDFQGEEGQRRLRELVTEAVTGISAEGGDRQVRRRVE